MLSWRLLVILGIFTSARQRDQDLGIISVFDNMSETNGNPTLAVEVVKMLTSCQSLQNCSKTTKDCAFILFDLKYNLFIYNL